MDMISKKSDFNQLLCLFLKSFSTTLNKAENIIGLSNITFSNILTSTKRSHSELESLEHTNFKIFPPTSTDLIDSKKRLKIPVFRCISMVTPRIPPSSVCNYAAAVF